MFKVKVKRINYFTIFTRTNVHLCNTTMRTKVFIIVFNHLKAINVLIMGGETIVTNILNLNHIICIKTIVAMQTLATI